MKSSQKTGEQLSRSMLYSGINIFGQLSQLYIQNKESGGSYSAFSSQIKPQSAAESDSSMMSLSPEVLAIFKKLQKRDSTTKIKAFIELDKYLAEAKDQSASGDFENDEMQNLLTFFLYHFCRIVMNEPDKKVREAAHQTFAVFIKKAKRRIGPHIKKIFSLWYCSFFDVSPEVANLSKKNFELAFPEQKRDQVFKIAYKNFLNFANEQLKQSEEQISESTADLSKAQREDVFDRITGSVLQALATSFSFTTTWAEDEKAHFNKKLIDILDLNVEIKDDKNQMQQSKKIDKKASNTSYLWGFLQSNYRGRVRSSCLLFISNLLLNLPKEVINYHINQLAPLIFNLIGEDNSSLQTTIWKEAIFTLGKNFPQSWETVQIKKNFLPKLYVTLKNAGFGAPVALYENFIKFSSIFPLYHICDYTEDKTNKASFKERCNLIREAFTTLYQGLKNDESVAFHQDLTKCYYETLVFLSWKRIQPLIQKTEGVPQEDKDFALEQLKKVIQVPVEDYINNFEAFKSKAQNQRNIRFTIPVQQAVCFRDMGERSLDSKIYETLISYIYDSAILALEKPNTIKLISPFIKSDNQKHGYFTSHILNSLIMSINDAFITQIAKDSENLNKDTIDAVVKKCKNFTRLLYKINKYSVALGDTSKFEDQKVFDILISITKKEEMAKNVLTQEVSTKFASIKDLMIKALILISNMQQVSGIQQFVEQSLNSNVLEQRSRNQILIPDSEFKKVDFKFYYEQLMSKCHPIIKNFMTQIVVENQQKISQNYILIDSGIIRHLKSQPNFIDKEDIQHLTEIIYDKINKSDSDVTTMSHYFSSIKQLIIDASQTNYDNFKHILFDKLLIIRSKSASYGQLWNMFELSLRNHISNKDSDFFAYCKKTLKDKLHNIIHHNSNFEVEIFNRFTNIVKSFVSLCQDKQQIVEEILLQEDNFTNLEHNSLPLKMFRDLFLSGGVAFDVSKLFTNDNRYVWLACALINARHLQSLANYIQLKKQLLIFVDTEVMPALIYQAQNGNEGFILKMFEHFGDNCKERIDYVYTLEHFVKKMIDPGEDFPPEEKPILKVDEFKQIFRLVNQSIVQKFLNGENLTYTLEVEAFIRILKQLAYFLVDESDSQKLFIKSSQSVQSNLISQKPIFDENFALSLEIYQCLYEYFKQEDDAQRCESLLIQLLQKQDEISDDINALNAALQFVAYQLSTLGVSKFKETVSNKVDFQTFMNKMIEVQAEKKLQPLTYIYLLSIIRKTIGGDLIKNKTLLIHQTIDIAKQHALSFDSKIQKIQESVDKDESNKFNVEESKDESFTSSDDQIENFEYEMLQDLAETFLVFPNYLNSSLNENDLYILISSGVESLQKAAFVLLKFLYENFIPDIQYTFEERDVIQQLLSEQEEFEKYEKEQSEATDEEKKEQEAVKLKYRNKQAFKNVSEIMIEILESPPNISHVDEEKQITGGSQIESMVFGDLKEGCMNHKIFGYFLTWNALLIKIENGRIKSQLSNNENYGTVLGALNEFLEENYDVYQMLLVSLIAYLPDYKRGLQDAFNVSTFEPEYIDLQEHRQNVLFAVYTLINFMKSFPSLARKYYQECERQLLDIVMPYIKQIVSPAILENEIKKIEVAQSMLGQNELTFALFKSTKEIMANYKKGEIELTLKIKIPAEYPMKLVEVEVSKQLKITEKQMRKWILAIRKTLQFQNGDIITAVLLWKNNIEKEIDGVEDCYICYCVVHETDQSLPKMPCKTCKNKFHVACIRKWFRTSHKSNCPICQNYFF